MLTIKDAVRIAARHGMTPARDYKCDIIDCMEQANEYEGQKARTVHWGTDREGIYRADRLFDGYMQETARVNWCDGQAARQFQALRLG